jgi:prephenate dehydratase/prephenate dehydrogenase
MGQMFARLFAELGHKVLISSSRTEFTGKELAAQSDVVIISVPIKKTVAIIEEIAPFMRSDALLLDFTSVKKRPLEAMLKAHQGPVLGCHPLFGPVKTIANQVVVLSPGRDQSWQERLRSIFEELGAIVEILEAEDHDRMMAVVQGITHFISVNFAYTLAKSGSRLSEFLKFQSPVYRFTLDFLGRILHQDAELYGSIQIDNPYSKEAVELFLNCGQELKEIVKNQNLEGFIDFFNQGKRYLGDFTTKAQKESDKIIEYMTQKKAQLTDQDFWLKQQSTADIAILGPLNTHSHLAAVKHFPDSSLLFARTILEVFDLVTEDRTPLGIVPVENIIEGSVNQTLDALFESDLEIKGLFSAPIHHNLVMLENGKSKELETIFSHPQALAQCREYLKKNYPSAFLVPTSSTSEAISRIKLENSNHLAAIVSNVAAQDQDLQIVAREIGDLANNQTRFVVIGKKAAKLKITLPKRGAISIAFHLQNKPGSLLKALEVFAQNAINLIKIYSRPTKKSFEEFYFFLDFEAQLNDSKTQKALKELGSCTSKLKILGEW